MKDITKKSPTFFFFIFISLIVFLTVLSIQNLLQSQQLIIITFPNAHGTTGNTLNLDPSQFTENQEEIYKESFWKYYLLI